MGCDIHLVVEQNTSHGWIGLHAFPYYQGVSGGESRSYFPAARDRNYERFAALAGVRGEGPSPKGLPADVSPLAARQADEWGEDGHSHSWLSLREACKIFVDTQWNINDWAQKYPESAFFGIDDEKNLDDYRIVFWFDN